MLDAGVFEFGTTELGREHALPDSPAPAGPEAAAGDPVCLVGRGAPCRQAALRVGRLKAHLYDFVVIGSGPSGRRAAIQAAKLGKSVLVVEKGRRVGGVSVHTGTIPSKTLRETVLNLTGWRERGFYGRAYRVKKDIGATDLMARLHMTLNHEVDVLEHQFARNSVSSINGTASFLDHTGSLSAPRLATFGCSRAKRC